MEHEQESGERWGLDPGEVTNLSQHKNTATYTYVHA